MIDMIHLGEEELSIRIYGCLFAYHLRDNEEGLDMVSKLIHDYFAGRVVEATVYEYMEKLQ